jgi:hypothetical protein
MTKNKINADRYYQSTPVLIANNEDEHYPVINNSLQLTKRNNQLIYFNQDNISKLTQYPKILTIQFLSQ